MPSGLRSTTDISNPAAGKLAATSAAFAVATTRIDRGQAFLSAKCARNRQIYLPHAQNNGPRDHSISQAIRPPMSLDRGSSVIKPTLFLGWGWCRSSRSRSLSGFWLAFFLHIATATTAGTFVAATAARATTALVTTTAAAFAAAALAAAAHRATTAATTTTMREQVAEATTERSAVATTARLTAAAAGRSTAAATAAASVASKPESIGAARNGQHGHDQSKAMKIHLTHLHLRTRLHAADVRRLANPESRACSASVGRDMRPGETVRFAAPTAPISGKMPVMRAAECECTGARGNTPD